MISSPRITSRTIHAAHLWHDRKRRRFVVYRRAGGVTKKTSVRYQSESFYAALDAAMSLRKRLHYWPADKLSSFSFSEPR